MHSRSLLIASALGSLLATSTSAQTATFIGAGFDPQSHPFGSRAVVSRDGSIAVATVCSGGSFIPHWWAPGATTWSAFSAPSLANKHVIGVSDSGRYIVGAYHNGSNWEGFIWSASAGLVALPDNSGGNPNALANVVSEPQPGGGGNVIVYVGEICDGDSGIATGLSCGGSSNSTSRACVWAVTYDATETTVVGSPSLTTLNHASGGSSSFPMSIAGDASTMVGGSDGGSRGRTPVMWPALTATPTVLDDTPNYDLALYTATTGSITVGQISSSATDIHPCRWGGLGYERLPAGATLQHGAVAGVSDDGLRMVGATNINGSSGAGDALIWDPLHGSRNLHTVLSTEYGLSSTLTNWRLFGVLSMSADGRVIIGLGSYSMGSTELWMLTMPPTEFCPADINKDEFVDFSDYLEFMDHLNDGC